MSERKKRKTTPKKGIATKSRLDKFKGSVVSKFTPKMYFLEVKKYINSDKNVAKEFKITYKHVSILKRIMIISTRTVEVEELWDSMSKTERVSELNSFRHDEEYILEKLLKRLTYTILKNLLEIHFPEFEVKGTKVHLVNEVVNRWFERTGSMEKRDFEAKFYDEIVNDQDYHHVTMCDTSIPRHVLEQIFRFIQYENDFFLICGSVCKTFYCAILLSWKRLILKNENVYNTSLMIYKSIQELVLTVKSTKEYFRMSEIEYIFEHVKPEKLRSIELRMKPCPFLRTLKFLCSLKLEFVNVREFRCGLSKETNHLTTDERALKKNWEHVKLSNLFPNLELCERPYKMELLNDCHNLKTLILDLEWHFSQVGNYKDGEKVLEISNKSSLKNLSIRFNYDDTMIVQSFLEGFDSLEVLHLVVCGYVNPTISYAYNVPKIKFYETIEKLKSLTSVEITDQTFKEIPMHPGPYQRRTVVTNSNCIFTMTTLYTYKPANIPQNLTKIRILAPHDGRTHYKMGITDRWNGISVFELMLLLQLPNIKDLAACVYCHHIEALDWIVRVVPLLSVRFGEFEQLCLSFQEEVVVTDHVYMQERYETDKFHTVIKKGRDWVKKEEINEDENVSVYMCYSDSQRKRRLSGKEKMLTDLIIHAQTPITHALINFVPKILKNEKTKVCVLFDGNRNWYLDGGRKNLFLLKMIEEGFVAVQVEYDAALEGMSEWAVVSDHPSKMVKNILFLSPEYPIKDGMEVVKMIIPEKLDEQIDIPKID